MNVFIVIGLIFTLIATIARFNLKWEVENPNCKQEVNSVKVNKINFYAFLIIGIISIITGIILII